jgi:hypothetical protein
MPVRTKGDFHGGFVVMNVAAVDLASHGAVGSIDTVITVEALDGVDQAPLQTTDWVMQVVFPITFTAGVAVQTAIVTRSPCGPPTPVLVLWTRPLSLPTRSSS